MFCYWNSIVNIFWFSNLLCCSYLVTGFETINRFFGDLRPENISSKTRFPAFSLLLVLVRTLYALKTGGKSVIYFDSSTPPPQPSMCHPFNFGKFNRFTLSAISRSEKKKKRGRGPRCVFGKRDYATDSIRSDAIFIGHVYAASHRPPSRCRRRQTKRKCGFLRFLCRRFSNRSGGVRALLRFFNRRNANVRTGPPIFPPRRPRAVFRKPGEKLRRRNNGTVIVQNFARTDDGFQRIRTVRVARIPPSTLPFDGRVADNGRREKTTIYERQAGRHVGPQQNDWKLTL